MTTKHSPLRVLKAQADRIAAVLKAIDRGDEIETPFAEKIKAARSRNIFKFGIIMDDAVITIEMPWEKVRTMSEVGIAEYILQQMRRSRDAVN